MRIFASFVEMSIPVQPEVVSFSIVYPKLCIANWSISYLIIDTIHISELLLNSPHQASSINGAPFWFIWYIHMTTILTPDCVY